MSNFKYPFLILLLFCVGSSYALDTSEQEKACLDIGFKKKTPAFANCVLELMDRNQSLKAPPQQVQTYSSNDPDDSTCQKYGFKPRTNEYANCRQQIDIARQQAQQQQAQYDEQKRQYDAQMAEYKKRRDTAANLALMQCGLNMMSTGNCSGVRNVGPAPIAPIAPNYGPRTYFLPGNRMMTCTTSGNITNCF